MLRYLADELPRLFVRLAVALLVYDLLLRIPWPPEAGRWIALGSTGFLTAAVLIICGKFLYDTFYPLQTSHSRTPFFYPRGRR